MQHVQKSYESILDDLFLDLRNHLRFVLARLGFENNLVRASFIEALYKHYVGMFPKSDNHSYYLYKEMKGELEFRKDKIKHDDPSGIPIMEDALIIQLIKPINQIKSDFITATDISNFVYCPVSYCIKRTFNEPPLPEKETKIGIEMHNQTRLAIYSPNAKKKYQFTESTTSPEFYTNQNKPFFDDIRSSSIYYVAHSDNSIKYFKSSKGKFVGQPDYVFTNQNRENFIVEEKFKKYKSYTNEIHKNNQYQLLSYLFGLDSLNASYGYYVYWYYAYEDGIRRTKKCVVYKFERNQIYRDYLSEVFRKISSLNSGMQLPFDLNKLDASKCANCVVRVFCGHKTGRFSAVTVPYEANYHQPTR